MTYDQTTSVMKPRPPYWVGVFCLIPLLGAIAGLVMLVLGITKYKDKWFAFIGVFGIVFTVGIYSYLFYYMKNGKEAKEGFAAISQMQLNGLVKNIEFYKLQHGQYPDNLQQLLEDDPLVPITDAIQLVQLRKDVHYHYEKVNDQYYLFSAGQDGIPNTKDDFYPKVVITDSSRIGLLKPM